MKIHQSSESVYVTEKSRFIAYLFPCVNDEDFFGNHKNIKAQHFNATHHCYAVITESGSRHSDDGEPSGTAGFPLLNCLRRHDLQNTGLVVVRYFGGIKLGKPGLVRAYTAAAEEVIKTVDLYEEYLLEDYEITLRYPLAERFRQYAEQYAEKLEISYGEEVLLRFSVLPGTSLDPYRSFSKGKEPHFCGTRLQERKHEHKNR